MNAVNNPEVEWQVRRIPLDAIQVDPTVQQRAAGTSQDVVDDYAEAMRDGVAFPPIDVFGYDDGPFHLGNGFHRLDAFGWRIPTPRTSNVRFTPAIVTTRFSSPAARTRSTGCGGLARTS
jgi:hypothetical protein